MMGVTKVTEEQEIDILMGKWLLSHLFAALVEDLHELGRKPTCLKNKKKWKFIT